ncbi:hypothetical protein C1752_14881 [Acaryochloris thomasi RCC1774]|uniref:DUF4177 domain-containing protein n=1 Tax=Acaryochloris thomasi RCC1774 TaxID=1764569 RepID=A0A2W1J7R6_9CYAN|nr:hypothetical protein [Acaryochloris thomasi]PZD70268.1 hypothetical protein C1752_14881 [Acaryochloris thomasi RCC1774]
MAWEYMTLTLFILPGTKIQEVTIRDEIQKSWNGLLFVDLLNGLGAEDWELTGIYKLTNMSMCVFKRPANLGRVIN